MHLAERDVKVFTGFTAVTLESEKQGIFLSSERFSVYQDLLSLEYLQVYQGHRSQYSGGREI
jgi:hypothetical protein